MKVQNTYTLPISSKAVHFGRNQLTEQAASLDGFDQLSKNEKYDFMIENFLDHELEGVTTKLELPSFFSR